MTITGLCEKCEERYGIHGKLAGGRDAWLCSPCGVAWSRYNRALPLWREHLLCLARERFLNGLAHGGSPPASADWEAWEMNYQRIQQELFEQADKWLGKKVGKADETQSGDGVSDGD